MLVGYCAMFLYTVLMLGRINMLELRLYLSLAGIISVFLGLIMSVSVASVLGFPYTTIHAVLPFLCLGSETSSLKCYSLMIFTLRGET